MKCAKSRNSKNSASASGSLGTLPGCRSASSETIRGDAEPTWCTCSSALGRPVMKSVRLTRANLADCVLDRRHDLRHRARGHLPVDVHRRRTGDVLLRHHLGCRGEEVRVPGLERGLDVGVVTAGLLDEAEDLALRNAAGRGLVGLVVVEQVV